MFLEERGVERFFEFLTSKDLKLARNEQLEHAKQMARQHSKFKPNYPPSKSGRYIKGQGQEFADIQVMQWLVYDHIEFLKEMQRNIGKFVPKVFLSSRLYGLVLFYKYYLGNREPN